LLRLDTAAVHWLLLGMTRLEDRGDAHPCANIIFRMGMLLLV